MRGIELTIKVKCGVCGASVYHYLKRSKKSVMDVETPCRVTGIKCSNCGHLFESIRGICIG